MHLALWAVSRDCWLVSSSSSSCTPSFFWTGCSQCIYPSWYWYPTSTACAFPPCALVPAQPCWSLGLFSWFLKLVSRALALHGRNPWRPSLPSLSCTLVPEGSFPGGPIDYLLEVLEVYLPKVQGFDFTLLLTHFSQDFKLHYCMITAAQEIHGGTPLWSLNK